MNYEVGKVYNIEIAAIKRATWNPAIRVAKIKELVDSMKRVGQLSPIVVTADLKLVDGHRRVAAAQELDWNLIQAIVEDISQKDGFAEINSTSRPLGARESMQSYLSGGPRTGTTAIRQMELMEWAIGIEGMRRVFDLGYGPGVMRVVTMLVLYCGKDTKNKTDIAKALWYTVNHSGTNALRAIFDKHVRMAPYRLWQLVLAGKKLPKSRGRKSSRPTGMRPTTSPR